MNKGSLVSLPNFCRSSNSKNVYSGTRTASCTGVAAVFVGMTLLLPTVVKSNIVLEQKQESQPYVQCDSLNQYYGKDTQKMPPAIDFLKVINLNKIERMANFLVDWNGNGASSFSKAAIDFFKIIISGLSKQPEVAPTGRNSMIMQYELQDKSKLVFEVSEKKVEKVYSPQGNYAFAECEIFVDGFVQKINCCVERFYGFK